MTTATAENRARLLNMAAGGNGHISDYIERVTLDGAAPEQQTAYIYHSPAVVYENGRRSVELSYLGTLEHCKKFYMLRYIELPTEQQPDMDAIPIADYGRHIAPDVWQQQYEAMREIQP
jgi:hypothetical protein